MATTEGAASATTGGAERSANDARRALAKASATRVSSHPSLRSPVDASANRSTTAVVRAPPSADDAPVRVGASHVPRTEETKRARVIAPLSNAHHVATDGDRDADAPTASLGSN